MLSIIVVVASARQEGMSAIDKVIAIFDCIHPCHLLSCAFNRNRDKMTPGQTHQCAQSERVTSCTDGHLNAHRAQMQIEIECYVIRRVSVQAPASGTGTALEREKGYL